MATRPCPCGWFGSDASSPRSCRCTPDQVERYRGRLSGPLVDRIDLRVEVQAVSPRALLAMPDGEPSSAVAARVAAARDRQIARQGVANAALDAGEIDRHCAADPASQAFLHQAAARLGWSGRRLHRTIKVARTIADLEASETIAVAHVAEALQAQRALDG